jgi:uncharacterized YigZ family protein
LQTYKTLKSIVEIEYIEKKSRFLSTGAVVSNETEARDFISLVRAKYPEANHNVYAYRLGAGAEQERFSDDGEPSGTAGKPVLAVMQKENITNCVIAVTRIFGGILLGASGLVRAYGKSASLLVKEAGVIVIQLIRGCEKCLPKPARKSH